MSWSTPPASGCAARGACESSSSGRGRRQSIAVRGPAAGLAEDVHRDGDRQPDEVEAREPGRVDKNVHQRRPRQDQEPDERRQERSTSHPSGPVRRATTAGSQSADRARAARRTQHIVETLGDDVIAQESTSNRAGVKVRAFFTARTASRTGWIQDRSAWPSMARTLWPSNGDGSALAHVVALASGDAEQEGSQPAGGW